MKKAISLLVEATQRMSQAATLLSSSTQMISEAAAMIVLLSVDGHSDLCPHENKIVTTTMGSGVESFYCKDCREDFVIKGEENVGSRQE